MPQKGRLIGIYLSITLFSFFWQLVYALTVTIRGRQASSAGIPNESARQTAWACAWINVVLSLFGCMLILLDLYVLQHFVFNVLWIIVTNEKNSLLNTFLVGIWFSVQDNAKEEWGACYGNQ
jgi:glucose-6-phosphate-specific signal transduction histidine kinase